MDSTPSIKLQIMQLILSLMQPLVQSGVFRKVARSHDLALNEAVRPALQIYDGPERLMRKDSRGRTYHFDIGLKILIEDARDISAQKDLIVPAVQKIMETNLQLAGLANIVDGGEEVPFVEEADKPLGGALVLYTIEYRRVLGDPYTTY
jgi:hypothetical protein